MNPSQLLVPSLYTVKAMLILDNDGNRIVAKYYDNSMFTNAREERAFEKKLFDKTNKANGEILMLDGYVCVYKSNVDVFFYVVGGAEENELILMNVLYTLHDAVQQVVRKNVEKRTVVDQLDSVFLIVDEIVDGGVILELDASLAAQRAMLRPPGEEGGVTTGAGESGPGLASVLASAREQIKWSLLNK